MSPASKLPFPLFTLPPELRHHIYSYAIGKSTYLHITLDHSSTASALVSRICLQRSGGTYPLISNSELGSNIKLSMPAYFRRQVYCTRDDPHGLPNYVALLLTSRHVRDEVSALLYSRAAFAFTRPIPLLHFQQALSFKRSCLIRHIHISIQSGSFTDGKFLGWGITLSALSKMPGLRTLELYIDVMGWVDGMMATAVREMIRRTEAGVRVCLVGCQAAKVDEWMCGVWWEGEKEVFAEMVWGKLMRCGRGTGTNREGQVGSGGDGTNKSWAKYVLWAPVERERMARRLWEQMKVME